MIQHVLKNIKNKDIKNEIIRLYFSNYYFKRCLMILSWFLSSPKLPKLCRGLVQQVNSLSVSAPK